MLLLPKLKLSLARSVFEATADFLSFAGAALTFLKIGGILGENESGGLLTTDSTPFALRLLLMILFSTTLAWALGSLVSRLTQTRHEHWHIVSYVLAIIFGAGLVTVAELISNQSSNGALPQVPLFSLIGACMMIGICRFIFRSRPSNTSASLHSRSIFFIAFATSCLVVLILLGLN
jgi:hypothetical protein